MNRTLGRISVKMWKTAPFSTLCFAWALISGPAPAQQPEQHWQATPSYPSNYPPNYQPPTAPAAGAVTGNPPASAPVAGQYPNQPSQPATAGPQYPTIEPRPGTQAAPGQYGPQYPADNRQGPAAQGQPIQGPPIQGPPARPVAPQAPFELSQAERNALENLLADWEKRNREIHAMESKFFRWRYDAVFAGATNPNSPPPPPDAGELKFASPDKAWMKIESKDAKHPEQSEQWLCDGKSVFQWDYSKKIVTEWMLPPERQGKAIGDGDGPLPFVFGIEAEKLKQRYFMRIITPPDVQNQVWLESYPKFQQDAANYKKVEVILQIVGPTNALFPFAIQVYAPNGKDRVVYQLQDPKINPKGGLLIDIFGGDWTKPSIAFGWTKKTELPPAPARQTGANPAMLQRR